MSRSIESLRLRRLGGAMVIVMAVTLFGCESWFRRGPASAPQQRSSGPAPEPLQPESRTPTRVYVRYDVLRVEVPVGAVSQSETLWNHVDESVLPFSLTRRLHLNGFRMGLVNRASWAPIKAVLDGMGAVRAMQAGMSQTDLLPFAIEIDSVARSRSVFHFNPTDHLVGNTFVDSRNMIRVEHTLNPEDVGLMFVRLIPEIRRAHLQKTLAATDSGLREIPVYEGRVFMDLSVEFEVPEGEIIVIGPSDRVGRKSLIGTEFLCGESAGVGFERVLFLTPLAVPVGGGHRDVFADEQ